MGKRAVSSVTRVILGSNMIACMIFGFVTPGLAQTYPTQPITLVVGMAPGGITDVATRTIANEAKKDLGVELLVVNKPGAMQTVAMSYVISSRPDGYTFGATTDAPYVRAPHMLNLNFSPQTETIPIIYYGSFPAVVIVKVDSPFKTFKDVIQFARENPGKLTYGTPGVASGPDLGIGGFALQMGLKIPMVPYTGDSEALLSLLGGQIMMAGMGIGSCMSQVKAGKVRILAVIHGDERLETFPDVPTLNEFGFKDILPLPGLGLFGPKGLPDPIVKKIEAAFKKASQSAEFKTFAANNYVYPMKKGSTGLELRSYLATASQTTGNLIQRLGLGPSKPK